MVSAAPAGGCLRRSVSHENMDLVLRITQSSASVWVRTRVSQDKVEGGVAPQPWIPGGRALESLSTWGRGDNWGNLWQLKNWQVITSLRENNWSKEVLQTRSKIQVDQDDKNRKIIAYHCHFPVSVWWKNTRLEDQSVFCFVLIFNHKYISSLAGNRIKSS